MTGGMPIALGLPAISVKPCIVSRSNFCILTALNPPTPAPTRNSFSAPPSKAITATDGQVTQRGQAGEGLKRDVDNREGSGCKGSRGVEGVRTLPREQMLGRVGYACRHRTHLCQLFRHGRHRRVPSPDCGISSSVGVGGRVAD